MKITILNGSPRTKGNTSIAVAEFAKAAAKHEVEVIDVTKKKVAACIACNKCQSGDGLCIHTDDTNELISKLVASDMIVVASPVYWMGFTAQTKLVIDKFYSKMKELKGKKFGLITAGGAELDDPQYRVMKESLEMIASYLKGELTFAKFVVAHDIGDMEKNAEFLKSLSELAASL